ncbi:unnamed protein product [Cylicocyclus nassatus]|uniref:Uncharacterized protein n=1 Tax=Cylicocyclus nassatus TaxID=53992 RepID=A0AA36DQQ7_CYLNA|nr:unnamed protein product [Cylicocyclus nassatus]
MKLILLLLAFLHLSSVKSARKTAAEKAAENRRFCSEGCPYLMSFDKNPDAKIDLKEVIRKCRGKNPEAPFVVCEEFDVRCCKSLGLEKLTWKEYCEQRCK